MYHYALARGEDHTGPPSPVRHTCTLFAIALAVLSGRIVLCTVYEMITLISLLGISAPPFLYQPHLRPHFLEEAIAFFELIFVCRMSSHPVRSCSSPGGRASLLVVVILVLLSTWVFPSFRLTRLAWSVIWRQQVDSHLSCAFLHILPLPDWLGLP